MSERWQETDSRLREEGGALKQSAMNRHDARFSDWHANARAFVQEFAPKKLPAFDEIRFASDFLLSKPEDEQKEINDRIALVSDVDLCFDLLDQVAEIAEESSKKEKARKQAGPASSPSPASAAQPAPVNAQDLRAVVDRMDLSSRDKAEILDEIERVERALSKPQPDWDQIKRVIRFLLDFDRTLAIEAIPLILARMPKS
ncbi:hypothetical protein NITGR_390014 [Nitrospina gracilis 3/211]|uniref:Uncharacterized protein n=1 Tax=Nitrospina gracilis (strain 3/211) TaxID=1266370 RepID=M1YYM2_NITG3|nr:MULTISPECIES: hypothetical protein [Nitrospina]MCF8723712.1 hypothetical protein [Nitrospina sp. Nb-3]CCQ90801.1 hypothetical protein NITGR_390014 [Nitrospina gracilis 3/211]